MSKKCTRLWREANLEVNMYKTPQVLSTFGSEHVENTRGSDHVLTIRLPFDVGKVHAVVARTTFRSPTCQKLRVLSLF